MNLNLPFNLFFTLRPHPLLLFIDACLIVSDNFSKILLEFSQLKKVFFHHAFWHPIRLHPFVDVHTELTAYGKPIAKNEFKERSQCQIM